MLPGLTRDAVVLKRPGSTADSEGNSTSALTTVYTGYGTYGSPSTRDVSRAASRGQQVDAVVTLPLTLEVKLGDRVDMRDKPWEVVAVQDVRTHQRVFVRRVDG